MLLLFCFAVDIGRSSYKAIYDVIYQAEKVGASMEVVRTGDNEKIVKLDAIYHHSGAEYSTNFLVGIHPVHKKRFLNIQNSLGITS